MVDLTNAVMKDLYAGKYGELTSDEKSKMLNAYCVLIRIAIPKIIATQLAMDTQPINLPGGMKLSDCFTE